MSDAWATLLAGFIGAIVGGAATWLVAQRSLRASNVLAERTRWREKIREIAGELLRGYASADRAPAWVILALNTSPFDRRDLELVHLAKQLAQPLPADPQRDELVERLALLLKHDWDRAKIEASWFPFFASRRARRVPYRAPSRYASRNTGSERSSVDL